MIKLAEDKDLHILTGVAVKLWSSHTADELADEFRGLMEGDNCVFFIAYIDGVAVGFAECAKRFDYVEGCSTTPVGYLEGIFIDKAYRRQGIGKGLLAACESWAKSQGCLEFASDCEADNETSLSFHLSSQFHETNRVICLIKNCSYYSSLPQVYYERKILRKRYIMKRKALRILALAIVIISIAATLVACMPPFKDAPQGISEDNRKFKVIKDERMDAVAPEYKAYIYKEGEFAFCFRLKSPKNIEENKTYPLIVFLHGMGDWGSDNSRHMYKSLIDNVEKYVTEECFVFMPQGIKKYSWEEDSDYGSGMNGIYNSALSEIMNKFAIDADRIYLTGMSMGGYGTFYQAYNNPEKYTAIAPICGYFPDEVFADLSIIKDMPIWLGHSRTDDAVDFAESERIYNRLIAAGAKEIHTTWLDEYKHDMTQPFYDNAEFWQWFMSRRK